MIDRQTDRHVVFVFVCVSCLLCLRPRMLNLDECWSIDAIVHVVAAVHVADLEEL